MSDKARERQSADGESPTKKTPGRTKRHPEEWRFNSDVGALHWSLASQRVEERASCSAPIAGSPVGLSLFEGRSLAVALPGTRC